MSVLQEAAERFADTSWQIHRQWSSKKTPPVNVVDNNNTIDPNQMIPTKTGNKIVTIETIQTTLTPQRTNNNESGYGTLNRSVKSDGRNSLSRQNSQQHYTNKIIGNNIDTTITDDEIIVKTEVPNNGKNQIIEYKIETIDCRKQSNGKRTSDTKNDVRDDTKISTNYTEIGKIANVNDTRQNNNQKRVEDDNMQIIIYDKEPARRNKKYSIENVDSNNVTSSSSKSVIVEREVLLEKSPSNIGKQFSVRIAS